MMKRALTAATLLLTVAALPCAAAESDGDEPRFLATFDANHSQFDSGDVDSDGSQSIAYVQLGYGSDAWGVNLVGSAARTDYQTLGGVERFSLTSVNDTDLATFYSFDLPGVTLRAGVDLRSPTGTAALTQNQLGSMMADDLATDLLLLNSFGRGWEVTPHLMAVGAVTDRFTAGLGLRFSLKGEYDPTSDADGDTLDPGDQLLGIVNTVYAVTEEDFIIAGVTYSYTGRDKQEGADVFRSGDTLAVDLRYLWSVTSIVRLTFGAVYQTQGKNERLIEEGVFSAEQANANNNSAERAEPCARGSTSAVHGSPWRVSPSPASSGSDRWGATATFPTTPTTTPDGRKCISPPACNTASGTTPT